MDLFSLLAKLTLDKTEYDKGLEDAEKKAQDLTIPTPQIPKVETKEFTSSLKDAEEEGNIFKEVMSLCQCQLYGSGRYHHRFNLHA